MLDPATGRAVAGRTVKVVRFADDAPLTTVSVGALGGYGRFVVEGEDAVSLIGPGGEREDLVSVEKQLEAGTSSIVLTDNGDGTATISAPTITNNNDGSATLVVS